ncbi:MAG: pentapeptide repeat-containing protein [Actinobacteria bacterium]|nr:pentapeptide repeat-containing protein [Actinomycetota bacterium]
MNNPRFSTLILGSSLLIAACGGGGTSPSGAADIELTVQDPMEISVDDDGGMGSDDEMEALDASLAGVDDLWEALIVETTTELEAVAVECSTADARVQPNADFSNRVFTGPDLRCADLTGASFVNATLRGVDLSGAILTGADFTGATLDITALGADFTRAVFQDADLTRSDLRGSSFAAADLSGSNFTDLPVGMALTDLTGARLGCNVLYGSAGMDLSGATIADECTSALNWSRVTLRGSFYGSQMTGFDLTKAAIEAVDFRRADLSGASLREYGILPSGIDFSGALLTQADLSAVGLYNAGFVGADLSFALLVDSFSIDSDFTIATLDGADLTGFVSERNSYVGAQIVGANMTNVVMTFDDLTDATIADVIADGLTMNTVKCPGASSGDRYGLCTVGTDVAF